MTIGHYPDRVLELLGFSAVLFIVAYLSRKAGYLPFKYGGFKRDEQPRMFALGLWTVILAGAISAGVGVAIFLGYGLELTSN